MRRMVIELIICYFRYCLLDKDVTRMSLMIVMTLSIAVQKQQKKLLINDVQTDT